MNRFFTCSLAALLVLGACSFDAGNDKSEGALEQNSTSVSLRSSSSARKASVKVTPDSTTLPFAENLIVTVKVDGCDGTSTGSAILTGGGYTSFQAKLNNGSATFYVQPGSLVKGADTLTATYQPNSGSSSNCSSAKGTAAITVISPGHTKIGVHINTLANRHQISPYIYGINSMNESDISNLSPQLVRFGGNEASNYNWKLFTYNAGGDWYFEDFGLGRVNSIALTQFTVSSGSHMLTTMPMLNWVAKSSGHWSYSVAKFGKQCKVNPDNSDAGNGIAPSCKTPITTQAVTDAYYPLVDTSNDCPTGTADGTTCLDRKTWAQSLAKAFGGATCDVPYAQITSCHFYDMDNEPEIWNGSHRDVHPVAPGYSELANLFVQEGNGLKAWDPNAVRFGPITCCWNFLWLAGSATDGRSAHAGIDYVPWWLNQVKWLDQINGTRTLDVFDVHSYVGPNVSTAGYSDAQLRAAAGMVYRTYWDPTYYNSDYDADWMTTTEPNRGVTFLIPRLKALVNAIYPGTPLSFTEWESFLVPQSEWDFATALSDADAFGVMGREGLSFSTRWGGPETTDGATHEPHPNYQGMKLYTNYDGAHHRFGSLSVADQSSVDPDLFTSYAALDASGTKMTIMVLNKDPNNTADVTFDLNGFSATTYTAYTLVSTNPGSIISSAATAWSATRSFAPYSITLLVINGTQPSRPATEWYLNPDDLMIPASGKGILHPEITSGTAPVTLSSAVFDAYEGAPACSGTLTLTKPSISITTPATITVNPGRDMGFCHYTVTGSDGKLAQTEGGWIVVGKPAAAFAVTGGNHQSGSAGTALARSLTVTLSSIPSGFTANGAEVLYSTSAGTLSNGKARGKNVIATTNASGVASVTLTLPSTSGMVTVTAQDQFPLGGATVTFTETAN